MRMGQGVRTGLGHGVVSVNYAVIVYCMLTMYVLCTHGPNGLFHSLI